MFEHSVRGALNSPPLDRGGVGAVLVLPKRKTHPDAITGGAVWRG